MRIITNADPPDRKLKTYSGARIFGRSFLEYLDQTPHAYTSIIFEKPSAGAAEFSVARKFTALKSKNRLVRVSAEIPTLEILSLAAGRPSKRALGLANQLARAMKEEKADVFFLNGFSALSYLLLKSAKLAGLPVVAAHHGIWLQESLSITKHLSGREIILRKAAEAELADLPAKNIFFDARGARQFGKMVRPIRRSKLAAIPLPINPIFLNKAKPAKKNGGIAKIGMVARWDKVKNHEAFLAAARQAKKQSLNWKFFAVTEVGGYKPYKKIEKAYKQAVAVLPPGPPARLKKFYLDMDVLVLPSRFESYSGVVAEALLQNRPVIVSPGVPWARTYARLGAAGWVADFKNPQKTVKIIAKALNAQVPPKLYEFAAQDTNPARIFRKYLQVLKSVTK